MISLSYPFFNSLEINFQTQSPSLVGSVNIAGTTAEIILRIHAVHVCPQRYVVGRTEHSHAVKADAAGEGLRQCIGKGDVLHVERSEEHTSELQPRQFLVCRLLLEKIITV